ncbi:MAG: FAD-dependent thymidylate synthase [Phycisphaerales bacterium]|jgi:thymidylate synthase (FAD)
MILTKPSIEFLWATPNPLKAIEKAGRICYKSEDKITDTSSIEFVQKLIKRGHLAMIEHASVSYRIICDRGITHEIVRHRLFSFAQESTRYCNYSNGLQYILPPWTDERLLPGDLKLNIETNCIEYNNGNIIELSSLNKETVIWLTACGQSKSHYINLIESGWTPQKARSVLIHSLKTEIVVTGNLRQWMGFFELRCSKAAHPQMQEVANMLISDIHQRIPIFIQD